MKILDKEIKIVGMTRVKNCAKYLPRLLSQYDRLCDVILVLDDKSTDNTFEICSRFPKVKYIFHDSFFPSNWRPLWKRCEEINPDFVLGLDGDELFDEQSEEELLKLIAYSPQTIDGWSFPFFYCYENEDTYRVDKVYNNVSVIRLFRYKKGLMSKDDHRHITASPEGLENVEQCDNIRIKHFGYMTEWDRNEKYKMYCERDKDLLEQKKVDYSHFAPGVKVEVKQWSDWKSKVKLNFSLFYKPGGFLQIQKISDLRQIKDNSVYRIYTENFLNYFSYVENIQWVGQFRRVLRGGGILEVKMPDFKWSCEEYLKSNLLQKKCDILIKFYGNQSFEGDCFISGYDYESLRMLLVSEGFEGLVRQEKIPEILHVIGYKKGE